MNSIYELLNSYELVEVNRLSVEMNANSDQRNLGHNEEDFFVFRTAQILIRFQSFLVTPSLTDG